MTTAAQFLTERRDFLQVFVVKGPRGKGWDVVLRVDGTYASEADAIAAVAWIRDYLDDVTDVPKDRRESWDAPRMRGNR